MRTEEEVIKEINSFLDPTNGDLPFIESMTVYARSLIEDGEDTGHCQL
jgi:hypothetical protein